MRKIVIALTLAVAGILGTLTAPRAEAAPSVKGLTPFTQATNFMSLPGYYRYRNYIETQTWIDYETAARLVAEGA